MHCVANGSEEQKERKKKRKREKKKMNDDEKLSVPLVSLNSKYFEDYSILNYSTMCNPITRTSVVPWDQPLSFAHVHHLKCVFHSFPLHK